MSGILFSLLTAGTAFSFYWLLRHREALRLRWPGALALAAAHTILGVICVKVFAVLETLDFSKAGSMSLFGGIFFLPVFYWAGAKLFRRPAAAVFDAFTPCMVFTLFCARINCLFAGCCQGGYLPGGSGLRWPTRELELVFYGAVLGYFWRREGKGCFPGWQYPFYMAAYGAFRFLEEGFRQSDSPGILHISHLWAALSFCLGLSIYAELKKNAEGKKKKVRKT